MRKLKCPDCNQELEITNCAAGCGREIIFNGDNTQMCTKCALLPAIGQHEAKRQAQQDCPDCGTKIL